VVAANESDSVWIPDFEDEKEEEGFDRVETAINKVAWRDGVI
jgi:hypothetical protein